MLFIMFLHLLRKKDLTDTECSALYSAFRFYVRVLFILVLTIAASTPILVKAVTTVPKGEVHYGVVSGDKLFCAGYEPKSILGESIIGKTNAETENIVVLMNGNTVLGVFTVDYIRNEYVKCLYTFISIMFVACSVITLLYSRLSKNSNYVEWFNFYRTNKQYVTYNCDK